MTEASMPTNIALIKYMGKKDSVLNIPDNSSFSYTLDNLRTTVKLTPIDDARDHWDSAEDKTRFIKHLDFLRNKFNQKQYFAIQSSNNFPSGCGLASSASSFAALTECFINTMHSTVSTAEKAALSRQGSGSSCRSFYKPFALWSGEKVENVELPYKKFIHHVIVVSSDKKLISSSQAHAQVKTSLLYSDRKIRAEKRLTELLNSFRQQDWQKSYEIIWQEFQDMLALFETAEKPFSYLKLSSYFVLDALRDYWETHHDGPLVTMDAGPNVHVLFREDQASMANMLSQAFRERFTVI
ncbi:MAG TPA: diphosphomevalonate decarboxylase [Gammaproteobacteria bacterium]|nr:diphosphomevalonate decarboxylase [Gammaproteobacteria bacterium]